MNTKMIHKVVRVGTMAEDNRRASIYCKISYVENEKGGKFSISGVIGPKSNGNAIGSCGQIDMEFKHRNASDDDSRHAHPIAPREIDFAEGWDKEKWFDFLDIWKRWHLNDMKANCEHQKGPEWTPKDVTLYHFELTDETSKAIEKAKSKALQVLKDGMPFTPSRGQVKLTALERTVTYHSDKLPDSIANYYQLAVKKYDWQNGPTETKSTSWLYEKDHPEGYLSKACPECGYKYGSSWLKEEIPNSVLEFVEALPTADKNPAWG